MLTKIFGYSFLLCVAGLLGLGLYEVYITAGIEWTLALAILILGVATFFAALSENKLC